MPLPRSSLCRKRLFSCQGTGEKNLSSGRHWKSRIFSLCPRKTFSSCGRHREGAKLNTPKEIFSLCAQWARISYSTCGPVGQKFPPTGLEVAFTYSEFQRGKSQPLWENILTPVVSKFGVPLGPGEKVLSCGRQRDAVKNNPSREFSLCDHWSGSYRCRWPIGPQLPTARFWAKNETSDLKKFLYLPTARFCPKNEPPFCKKYEIFFRNQLRPHWIRS